MKTFTSGLVLLIGFCFAVPRNSVAEETPLSDAVSTFNKKALSDPIGKGQPPISVEEVVAAVLLWERGPESPVSDELLQSFKRIAESKTLPENSNFESLNGYDRGGAHVFDVWSVRIRMERDDGSSYAFVIRERVVASRTLREELKKLDQFISENEVEKWVGGYRILERKKDLEARINIAD